MEYDDAGAGGAGDQLPTVSLVAVLDDNVAVLSPAVTVLPFHASTRHSLPESVIEDVSARLTVPLSPSGFSTPVRWSTGKAASKVYLVWRPAGSVTTIPEVT